MWIIFIKEYYSAIESDEVLIHTTAGIKLKNMLSVKATHVILHNVSFHLCEMSRIAKFIETDSRLVVATGERKKWGLTANEYSISLFV